ncbi:hypothetical protein UFOVP1008_7 [uncultured Caudovirales phage]|uniref:Holliday junction resolvase n=1 Tax=uncultured Caudovirales phage TaxID=2100421 RepID=A0A6J5R1C4_9CAUD|nr:hypothetical protein UFOVP498_15 [uncultured Caudovirales phage]CAB4177536.1 hypothetical protein UFOVP1008_7 [uncultured Caudovirales phage]CAB4187411.1 hypothetical protein UFOVP1160_39 [uncultured Caudovirales phage]CAB4199725.1 hypothetical protein UFOVP1352_11 [uncultured Caudovirales phage]
MITAKSAKAKGSRLEKAVQMALQAAGATARKQPGSGIYSAFPADVYAEIPGLGPILIECKSHKSPLKTIRNWLGKATVLVHKADQEEALVTVPLSHYCQMVKLIADEHFTVDEGNSFRERMLAKLAKERAYDATPQELGQ